MAEDRRDRLNALYLFLLAFVVRSLLISKGPFHLDVLELAMKAESTINTPTLHYMHWAGYPLAVIVASLFVLLFRFLGVQDPIFCVNFMSVVLGSLGIGAFYLLSKKILDNIGALFASLMLCFFPLHLYISTLGFNHTLSVLLNLVGFYLLFLYLEDYELNKLILSAILFGFASAARLNDSLVILAAIFLYLYRSLKDCKISKISVFIRLIRFSVYLCLIALIFYMPMFLDKGFSQFRDTLSIYYNHYTLNKLSLSLASIVDMLQVYGIFILLAGIGYWLFEKKKYLLCFLLLWCIVIFVYYGSFSCFAYRYLLLSITPLFIIQGYFIAKAFKRLKLLIPFLLLIIFINNLIDFYPYARFRQEYNLQKEFAEFVRSKTESSSYVIVMDEGPFIQYYGKRNILYKATGLNKSEFDEFFEKVDTLLNNRIPIYIITTGIYGYDPKGYFKNALINNYDLKYVGRHLNQDWHQASIYESGLMIERLYKVEKKT
jgi:hypothetical protein